MGATVIDLEAQVLRNGLPFTRPTRWAHGLDSFDEPLKVAHWKLFPGATNINWKLFTGATNIDALDVVLYVQHAGWVRPLHDWALIRVQLSIDGVVWPQTLPGQLFIPLPDSDWSKYQGYTVAMHFDDMTDRPHLAGIHTVLLRAIREEAA